MFPSLTQAHLTLLETCPRQFQHTVLDRLTVPPSPDVQIRQQWGSRFHLLMQQRELGLPIAALPQDDDLQVCLQGLMVAAPDLFRPRSDRQRFSEQRREFLEQGYLFTVIFDLLLLEAEAGQIIDWKTYRQPRSVEWLEQSWQTRLYLYALVQTSHLLPEQVSMTYWFVHPRAPRDRSTPSPVPVGAQSPPAVPQAVTLSYSQQQHRRTQADLHRLTQPLADWISPHQAFPQVDAATGHCTHCPFAIRCQRLAPGFSPNLAPSFVDLASVVEVPI